MIALAADFRVVGTSGRFAFLFTKVGLSGGDMGAAYLLPRVVGLGRATSLLMLGDTIDAETADRYGLVSQLVADEELDDAVAALAARIAAGPTLALAQTKSLLTRELDMSLSSSMELDAMTQALLMTTARPRGVPRGVQRRPQAGMEGRVVAPVAVVTGAGQGVGRAVALRLATADHRVVLVGRDLIKLEKVAAEIASESLCVAADLTDADEVLRAFSTVEETWGPAATLVANAGTSRPHPSPRPPTSSGSRCSRAT